MVAGRNSLAQGENILLLGRSWSRGKAPPNERPVLNFRRAHLSDSESVVQESSWTIIPVQALSCTRAGGLTAHQSSFIHYWSFSQGSASGVCLFCELPCAQAAAESKANPKPR